MRILRKSNLILLRMLLVLALMHTGMCTASAEQKPGTEHETLTFGFFPIISTVALYKRFAPLKDYLAEELGIDIRLQTAKDFPTFFKRTAERQYDILVTAPHFAVNAQDSGNYMIRATLTKDVQQLFVVKKDSSITRLEQLEKKLIGTPPESALMTMMGKQFLSAKGLTGDSAPKYRAYTSHNAANQALIGDEVDAVIASSNIVRKALERGEPLRILSEGEHLPNMATLVATDKNAQYGDRIVRILINMKNTEKGREVLKKVSFPSYREVSAADYEPARPYMEMAQQMKQSKK